MRHDMRITFVISTVSVAGGAQRVLAYMANYWAEKGWKVTVLTYNDGSKPPFYEIHPMVRRVPMNTGSPYSGIVKALVRNLARALRLRKEIVKSCPSSVISMGDIDGIRTILATLGLKIPVVVSEHLEPSRLRSIKNGWIWNALRWLLYPLADSIVVLTEAGKDYFGERVRKRMAVIPNAVPEIRLSHNADEPLPDFSATGCIVTAGRLVPQKRIDLLLKAYTAVAGRVDANLIIAGDGPLRKDLETLRDDLGLGSRALFTGTLRNPWAILKDAKIFVLSSEFEGFPMVLLEAMACGLPVVSFDCPTGPREIVRHGIDGVLVPPLDVMALSETIELLMNDERRRQLMAEHASEVKDRFSLSAIMGLWERLVCK